MHISARSIVNYQVEIDAGNHQWISDEPAGVGGEDAGPSPFALLLGGLASCTIITIQMYAQRKQWPLEGIEMEITMRSEEVRLDDGSKVRNSVIDTQLAFQGPLTPEQMKRLETIASHCPVHRTLKGNVQIVSSVKNMQGS